VLPRDDADVEAMRAAMGKGL